MNVPEITQVRFKVSKKAKGKRNYWCEHYAQTQMVIGWSQTSIEAAYKDFRRQWKALHK